MGGFDCAACQVVRLGDAAVSIVMQYYKLHLFGRHIFERLFSFMFFLHFNMQRCRQGWDTNKS